MFRSLTPQRLLTERRIAGEDVANFVHTLCARARLEGDFGAHSLPAGFVTAAAQAGVPLDNNVRTTRQKSIPILIGYVRRATTFDDPALARVIS